MLFWIRFFAGNLPEILGKTFSFDYNDKKEISRIKTKQEPGRFVLHIRKTEQSDTAFYYCLISQHRSIRFLEGIFLRVEGPEPDITAVIQHFLPDPVHPGDSVTLQCSVLSDSEKNTCPEQQHSVFWFNIGSDESPPSLIYAQTNSGDECERSLEAPSLQSCVYSFFKENISSSDAGTYYCAVVACGMVVFGNGTKLDIEVVSTHDSQKDDTFLFLLCAALAVSLIVIVFLVHAIRKKSCDCCKDSVALQPNSETVSGNEQNHQLGFDCTTTAAVCMCGLCRQGWIGHLAYRAMPGGPKHIFGPAQGVS
ncbi:signal-regulatory protein beta-2-like [Amphiprion ocellaris]|uniref:signal-regulatory protein beta-2-like n=1 Tax=Amphiprion ocellaris TaxID=80972 RepID=UPI0024113028|nr:signal-regulatory protein beta-2-like [Amphiprion ocellaris]